MVVRKTTHTGRAPPIVIGEAAAATPAPADPALRVRVHVRDPPFRTGVPAADTVENTPPPALVQALETAGATYVHAGREAPRPTRGGPRVKREAIGSGRGLEEAAPASKRPPPRLAGVAIGPITARAATDSQKTRPAGQAVMVAEPPRELSVRVAVTSLDGLAFQRLSFIPEPVRARRPLRRPRVRRPPCSTRATQPAATVAENPVSLRKDTRRGHGLPVSERVVKTPPAREVPRATAIATEGT